MQQRNMALKLIAIIHSIRLLLEQAGNGRHYKPSLLALQVVVLSALIQVQLQNKTHVIAKAVMTSIHRSEHCIQVLVVTC
jgi:hypothetical protein